MVERRKVDEQGNVVQLWNEVDGVIHGPWRVWSANGVLIYEVDFLNGKEQGEAKVWDENGNLTRVCHFEKGELHGHYLAYWANGKVKEEGEYRHGKRVAPYTWYNQVGDVIQTI